MGRSTAVSGVRPTGRQHLGNYFGAVANFVRMQDEYDSYFFVADLHSLTTHPKPEDLHANTRQILIEYLACGLDPDKCTLYVQSDLPQIPQLYLIFNMLAYMGELERSATFKDKVRTQPDNVNAGLLTYPVLMAVDILIHRAAKVPVGKDQEQHLEMTRDFAGRFNHLYQTDFFPLPEAFSYGEGLVKIPGLDGKGKMSKSNGDASCIYLDDEAEVIRKKIMKAVSDSGPASPGAPKSDAVSNLFDLMKAVSSEQTLQYFEDSYLQGNIRYGDMKKQLAEDMIAFTDPIRERIRALHADPAAVSKALRTGKEKAWDSAEYTLREVRHILGLRPF